jgi:tripartite-type tricarboxylate transporter receptor subunit TctC
MKVMHCLHGVLLASAVVVVVGAAPVCAQTFPAKPLRMVVAYPSGTTTDLLARMITPKMSAQLGKPIVVENKGGASGSVGAQLVANATPDGYTVMLGTSGIMAGNDALMPKLSYSPGKDFAAVGGIAHNPMLLAVGAVTGVRSVAELVEFLKQNPAKSNFGSTGVGGTPALAAAVFLHASGLKANHVPYNSAAQVMTALVSGEVTFMFYGSLALLPLTKSGQLRVLANGGSQKSGLFPELKSMAELGYKDFAAASWFALYVPAQTPRSAIAVLAESLNAALKDPEIAARLVQSGFDVWMATPDVLNAFGAKERARYKELVKRFGGIEN